MYKILLCWRYLLTRYLAMACIISVMLGVATLIVVNSVMAGFSTKLRDRLHGLLSDVVLETYNLEGFPDPEGKMARIRQDPFLNERIDAMTSTLESFAMLQYRLDDGQVLTRPIRLIGIDITSRSNVGDFSKYLVEQKYKGQASFALSPEMEAQYRARNPLSAPPALPPSLVPGSNGAPPPPAPPRSAPKQVRGIILGNLLVSYRVKTGNPEKPYTEKYFVRPGDQVIVTTVSGAKLTAAQDHFVVVDYFKSEMSEYDNSLVFAPLEYVQHMRSMEDCVTSIQIKLKNYRDAGAVTDRLKVLFTPSAGYNVNTWEEKQGPLLQAIAVERGILNVLLFLIIGVAGFGILAIFSMIVSEKTRDIGILKALGASNGGVMKIFLGYGSLLGAVGAGLGTGLGLWLTYYINEVEQFLSGITGSDVFPRDVYYFTEIPTDVSPWSVGLVASGAMAIAVVFSVLPALRAALLHPVRALRYE